MPLGVSQGAGHFARTRDAGDGRAGFDGGAVVEHCPHGLNGAVMRSNGRFCTLRRLASTV